jgi:flagellar basal body-associated protein FliL
MSEETQESQSTNDGTWSGLKKTIIGTVTTVVAGGGVWVSTLLFGGHSDDKEGAKTEQAAQPVINVNVQQNQENKQKVEGGGTTVIHEKEIVHDAAPAQQSPAPKPKQDDSW